MDGTHDVELIRESGECKNCTAFRKIRKARRNRIGFSFSKALSRNLLQKNGERDENEKQNQWLYRFAAPCTLCFCRWPSSRLAGRLIRLTNGTNPPWRLSAMTARRRVRANPERSPSPNAWRISEQSKMFTGVTGSGQQGRIPIPSRRSMR